MSMLPSAEVKHTICWFAKRIGMLWWVFDTSEMGDSQWGGLLSGSVFRQFGTKRTTWSAGPKTKPAKNLYFNRMVRASPYSDPGNSVQPRIPSTYVFIALALRWHAKKCVTPIFLIVTPIFQIQQYYWYMKNTYHLLLPGTPVLIIHIIQMPVRTKYFLVQIQKKYSNTYELLYLSSTIICNI